MGLGFLGRGKVRRVLVIGGLHVAAASLGGAVVGGTLGGVGSLLDLSGRRLMVIVPVSIYAVWHALRRRHARLGLQRQVPQSWSRSMSPAKRYFWWGVLLGSGVATLIPYSGFLMVLGAQVVSGVLLGAASGAVYGGMRQVTMLTLLANRANWRDPDRMPRLLPMLAEPLRRANSVIAFAGSIALIIGSWPAH